MTYRWLIHLYPMVIALTAVAGCKGGDELATVQVQPSSPTWDDPDWTISVTPSEVTVFPGEGAVISLVISRKDMFGVTVEPEGSPRSAVDFVDGETSRQMLVNWVETAGDHDVRLRAHSRSSLKTAEAVIHVRQLGDTPGIDPTFGKDGIALSPFTGLSGQTHLLRAFADRRILVAGYGHAGSLSEESIPFLGVLSPTGGPDPAFGVNGFILLHPEIVPPGVTISFRDIAIDSIGRIIVCIRIGQESVLLERYTPDGTLDETFGVNGSMEVEFLVESISVDSSGRLLVLGRDERPLQATRMILRRFLDTGEPDTSFADAGAFTHAMAAHGTIRLDAAERPTAALCTPKVCDLVRLDKNGVPDPTFGVGGIARVEWPSPWSFDVLPNGEYAFFGVPEFRSVEITWARVRSNGTLDEEFGPGGLRRWALPFRPTLSAVRDGIAFVAGIDEALAPPTVNYQPRWGLSRFTAKGDLDPSFGRAGTLFTTVRQEQDGSTMAEPNAGIVDHDGKLVLAGQQGLYSMYFVRYR